MATRAELLERDDVQAKIAELKADPRYANKRIRPIDTTIGVVYVQNPSKGQYNVAGAQIMDDDKGTAFKAFAGLFRMSVIFPEKKDLDALLDGPDGFPGALDEPEAMRDFRRHMGHCREADAK